MGMARGFVDHRLAMRSAHHYKFERDLARFALQQVSVTK
jgi:hypothetical protein